MDVWTRPDSYAGHNPEGEYCIYAKNRDSQILDEVNYDGIFGTLIHMTDAEENDNVYDWRASHWACGWVEYLMVKDTAPDAILIAAARMLKEIEDCPILDDQAYSDAQFDALYKYWSECSLGERVEYCRENDENIFQARDKHSIPEKVYDDLSQSEMFY